MKSLLFQTLLSLCIASFLGCTNSNYGKDNEYTILNEIFANLTDSLIYYPVFPPPPPPRPQTLPQRNSVNDDRDIQSFISADREYHELISKIDTSRWVLSIHDTLEEPKSFRLRVYSFLEDSSLSDYRAALKMYIETEHQNELIDLTKIKNTGKYELISSSQTSKLRNKNHIPEYNFIFFGEMTISKIYIDKQNTCGFLTCEIRCGYECHSSYLILIKKVNNTWTIKKGIMLSIA